MTVIDFPASPTVERQAVSDADWKRIGMLIALAVSLSFWVVVALAVVR
jgi:hypothetical protein